MIRAMAACDGRGMYACAADEGLLQTEGTGSTGERGDKAMIDDGSMAVVCDIVNEQEPLV